MQLTSRSSGWKRDNGRTLSLGAELNRQYCGFLTKPLQAVASFLRIVIGLCTNLAMLDHPLHEKLPCLQLFIWENYQQPGYHPYWSKTPTNSPYGLTYCFIFLQNLTPCYASAAHVNKAWHSPRFVHILQMNCNSAWHDHRYCSVDIKCVQAGQRTEARWALTQLKQQDKRCFCHQATLPLSRQSQCSSLCYLMRFY